MHWVGSVQRLIFPLATDAGLNSRWMTEQMAVVLQFHKNDVSRAATTILNHASEGGDHLVATLEALQNFNDVQQHPGSKSLFAIICIVIVYHC